MAFDHQDDSVNPDYLLSLFEKSTFANKHNIRNIIAKGGFGAVYSGVSIENKEYAMKVIDAAKYTGQMNAMLHNEANIMGTINHPNMLTLMDMHQDQKITCLVMNLMECNLSEYLKNHLEQTTTMPSEEMVVGLMKGIVSAVHHMHANHYAHSDIKPENILISFAKKAFLGDFGLSEQTSDSGLVATEVGTDGFMAPEVYKKKAFDVRKADVFALAVSMFSALTGTLPDEDDMELIKTRSLDGVSTEAQDFLRDALEHNPKRRATMLVLHRSALLNKYNVDRGIAN